METHSSITGIFIDPIHGVIEEVEIQDKVDVKNILQAKKMKTALDFNTDVLLCDSNLNESSTGDAFMIGGQIIRGRAIIVGKSKIKYSINSTMYTLQMAKENIVVSASAAKGDILRLLNERKFKILELITFKASEECIMSFTPAQIINLLCKDPIGAFSLHTLLFPVDEKDESMSNNDFMDTIIQLKMIKLEHEISIARPNTAAGTSAYKNMNSTI